MKARRCAIKDQLFTFLVGGKAGEGVKKAGNVAAALFASLGRRVFQMDDYMSLIKGGHNFSVVSTSTSPLTSHYLHADLVVALDERSYRMHQNHFASNSLLVYNSDLVKDTSGSIATTAIGLPITGEARHYPKPELRVGVAAIAVLASAIGLEKEKMAELIRSEYPSDLENNIAYAETIYKLAHSQLFSKFHLTTGKKKSPLLYGSQALSLGAYAGGLDIFFAYPMTPSSPILHYLASKADALGISVIHPENEIAVANMAIGAASVGARSMVASSGGGFALMEEALSLAGMTETPLLCLLASRPGPSTGVPTYTAQGDLRFALGQGHGEFPRIVASPGSIEECFYLTAEMMQLCWQFQTPAIVLTEKHMVESAMTVDIDPQKTAFPSPQMHSGKDYQRYLLTDDGISPLLYPPSSELIKWNSYEHDEKGITTEAPEWIARMQEKRQKKAESLALFMRSKHTVNRYGDGETVIFTYGSTTLSVREALSAGGLAATVVQPVYLSPLPVWELEKYNKNRSIVVEMSAAGQFAELLQEKAGITPGAVIKKYDGRPFEPEELAAQLKEVL